MEILAQPNTLRRLNPVTSKPFEKGDVREDGFIFYDYCCWRPLRRDGTFVEQWKSPEAFQREKSKRKCKRSQRDSDKKRIKSRINFVQAVKSETGCFCCGYNVHPSALDLDHRDGAVKAFNIGQKCYSVPFKNLIQEILKCDVLCANCHRLRSNKLLDVTDEQRSQCLSEARIIEIAIREKTAGLETELRRARRRALLQN